MIISTICRSKFPNLIHLPKPLHLSCDLDGHTINISPNGRGHGVAYISLTPQNNIHDEAYLEVYFEFWADIRLIDDEYIWHGVYAQIDRVRDICLNNITIGDCLYYLGDTNCPTIKEIISEFIYVEGEKWLNENFDDVFGDFGKICYALSKRN